MGKIKKFWVKLKIFDNKFSVKEFSVVSKLIPHANNIIKLAARCEICFKDSLYTCRRSSMSTNIIGGIETYVVYCRGCYLNRKANADVD